MVMENPENLKPQGIIYPGSHHSLRLNLTHVQKKSQNASQVIVNQSETGLLRLYLSNDYGLRFPPGGETSRVLAH